MLCCDRRVAEPLACVNWCLECVEIRLGITLGEEQGLSWPHEYVHEGRWAPQTPRLGWSDTRLRYLVSAPDWPKTALPGLPSNKERCDPRGLDAQLDLASTQNGRGVRQILRMVLLTDSNASNSNGLLGKHL